MTPRRARRSRRRGARLGAVARIAFGSIVLVAVLLVAVFPTRTLLDQREAISSTRERLELLRGENQRLEEQITRLQMPEEIERLAREQYNLARPGEEVFVIIPSEMEALRRLGTTTQVVDTIRESWGFAIPGADVSADRGQ